MTESLVTFVCVFIIIAFFIIAEKKVMASIQRRMGPKVVGFRGALQAFADGFKLIFKKAIIPAKSINYLAMLTGSFLMICIFVFMIWYL